MIIYSLQTVDKMIKTNTKTSYPELVDSNIANSTEFVKKYSNFLDSIGSISYGPPEPLKLSNNNVVSQQPPALTEDGSYEVEARITAYSRNEPGSDIYTQQGLASMSKTYGPLVQGKSVAVDKNVIPYGSTVSLPGLGSNYLAMDTGGAVISRTASRSTGGQPVIDVYFDTYEEQQRFVREYPQIVKVKVYPPTGITPPTTSIVPSSVASATVKELQPDAETRNTGDLTEQLTTSINYWNAKKSGDPITDLISFFNTLDISKLNDYENDFIFFWFKKFNSTIDEIKYSVELAKNSFLNTPSDSIGVLANTRVKFDDAVSPLFDLTCSFGAPSTIPVSLSNKLSEATKDVNEELSLNTTKLMKNNLINLQRVSDNNIAIDSTQPHGLNLVTDLNFYLTFYNQVNILVNELVNEFNVLYEYVCYFSNINDKLGYNPRNYISANIQSIQPITFKMNVENIAQDLDLLKRKTQESMSPKTIERTLSVARKTQNRRDFKTDVTTKQINDKFKYQQRTFNIKTPASLTGTAQAKLNAALSNIRTPNVNLTNLNNAVSKAGISNLPLIQETLGPTNALAGSVNNAVSNVTLPVLNMPNILPSLDPGSFPEISAIITNTDLNNLDANSALALAEQTKETLCNFELPILGKVDFGNITGSFDLDGVEAKFKSLLPKFPKIDDFTSSLKNLIPDFNTIWKDFYSRFFECSNKKDF